MTTHNPSTNPILETFKSPLLPRSYEPVDPSHAREMSNDQRQRPISLAGALDKGFIVCKICAKRCNYFYRVITISCYQVAASRLVSTEQLCSQWEKQFHRGCPFLFMGSLRSRFALKLIQITCQNYSKGYESFEKLFLTYSYELFDPSMGLLT